MRPGVVEKPRNCPKIHMLAEAGIQERQFFNTDSRFHGNDAEWKFLDGPVLNINLHFIRRIL